MCDVFTGRSILQCSTGNKKPETNTEVKAEDQKRRAVRHWRDRLLLPMFRPKRAVLRLPGQH